MLKCYTSAKKKLGFESKAELRKKMEIQEAKIKEQEKIIKQLQELNKANSFVEVPRGVQGTSSRDFYAGVINITHISDLQQGWEVKINNWRQFLDLSKRKGTIVTVVGNYNKGKTFLFELLSGTKMPYGFNNNTQGISIVYLNDSEGVQDTPVIGLDTRGGSLPLDLSLLKKRLSELETARNSGDVLDRDQKEKDEDDILRQILRDHEATEDIIQNFILEEASIICVMLSDLTFEDQKLVNKIKKKFKNDGSKKIIVIHNLYHTHYNHDIEYKINEFISKAFLLQKENFTYVIENKNRAYFAEEHSRQGLIPHVILAKEGTEAGNCYNEPTIKYLRSCIQANDKNKSVNIVDAFYNHLQRNLFTYVKCIPDLYPDNIKLERDTNQKPVRIYLDQKDNFEMKAACFDEFGHLSILDDEFQPPYSIKIENISETEKYFCLMVECPGFQKVKDNIYSWVVPYAEEFLIRIKGQKKENLPESAKNVVDNRHFGAFCIETERFKHSDYHIPLQEPGEFSYIDGMATFKWRLLPPQDHWNPPKK